MIDLEALRKAFEAHPVAPSKLLQGCVTAFWDDGTPVIGEDAERLMEALRHGEEAPQGGA